MRLYLAVSNSRVFMRLCSITQDAHDLAFGQAQCQRLAAVASSDPAFLQFEVRDGTTPVDPVPYLE